jgi:hypothetical protein
MLAADPEFCPDAPGLLNRLRNYLVCELRLAETALPNITLLAQPLPAADRWKLFSIADTLIQHGELPEAYREQAVAAQLPFCSLEALLTGPQVSTE